jgi:hypothetical protein
MTTSLTSGPEVQQVLGSFWSREHLAPAGAVDAIAAAHAAIAQSEKDLADAVAQASAASLSWAKIGAAAGSNAQAAHERWGSKNSPTH